MKRNERKLVNLIREEYTQRLNSLLVESVKTIKEAEMFDKEGNQLLSKGLKVRHKSSGYEYTVDHVEGKGEDAVVFLRHPEAPRIKPGVSADQLIESDESDLDSNGDEGTMDRIKVDQVDLEKIMGNTSAEKVSLPKQKDQTSSSLLKITKKEFEKDYEVK